MDYWIFVVTNHIADGESIKAEEIFNQRMADRFWGLGEKTPNRTSLKEGDRVTFYIGNPHKAFAGSADLSSGSFRLSDHEREEVSHGKGFYRAEFGVRLKNIEIWEKRRPVDDLIESLGFIENKEFWFAYFQGGVRQISERDFLAITEGGSVPRPVEAISPQAIDSPSQFALEAHLEEFMDRNWEHIDFGRPLARYSTDEQTGRQFPAGQWSIDFLCTDKETGDFVVLELKRGKTSDSAVGQVLRYISWVRRNLASSAQGVRGIIITKAVDESLQYAVQDLENVRILEYKVDFKLSPFEG